MTSLTDTLPILDEAVPALPAKVEEVARAGDAFGDVARKALTDLQHRRRDAEAAAARVQQALDALRARAAEAAPRLEAATGELREAAEQEANEADHEGDELRSASHRVVMALAGLETQARASLDPVSAAHGDVRTNLGSWAEASRTGEAELGGHADQMTSALEAAAQAVSDGGTLVGESSSTLMEAMERLLMDTQAHLQQMEGRLDELQAEQETAVAASTSELSDGREQIALDIYTRVQDALSERMEPALDAAVEAMDEMAQQAMSAEAETRSRREQLDHQRLAMTDLLIPVQTGLDQAKEAAQKVAIAWA